MDHKMTKNNIDVYIDFKSPYAYIAIDPTRKFAKNLNLTINWVPYVLEIPDFLGSAQVDNTGKIIESKRNDHQWRRVKYSYMDCRRYANLRNITVLGPQKIWNTNLVSISLLWIKEMEPELGDSFIDFIYLNFWKRNLDIEKIEVIENVFKKIGAKSSGFKDWKEKEGKIRLQNTMNYAHKNGVFGVPSYFILDELYWGREQLPLIQARITGNYDKFI